MNLFHKFAVLGCFLFSVLPISSKAELSALETIVVVEEEVPNYQIVDGQIEAVNKSTVSSQTAGVISKLPYDVGDYVEQGALIAQISSKNQQSGLQQAQAAVNEAKAAISSATAAELQAQAATKEAKANYKAVLAEFNRVKSLYNQRIISRSQYDQAEAAMKSSVARVESAKANENAAKGRTQAAQSNLAAAKAGVSKAGEQLGYTELVAPYSGMVTARHVELGEIVNVGTPVITGISLEKIRAVTHVPQRLIATVRKNKTANIYTQDNAVGIAAKKLTIFPYADAETNAFKVRASLASVPQGLFPGMHVKVGFNIGTQQQLLVPASAIAYRSEVTAVYVIAENGIPKLRLVRLGQKTANGKVHVVAGLEAGETIALDPVHAAVFMKTQQQSLNEGTPNG